jgi:hypothetical protein
MLLPRHPTKSLLTALAGLLLCQSPLSGARQSDPVVLTPQADDVWVYTFGQGSFASVAPTYASVFGDEFPDRFATLFLTFDAAGVLPDTDRPVRINSMTLKASMLNSSTFDETNGVFYDPSYDSVASYLDPALDLDPGRPMELYAVGYRNGFTLNSWRAANFPVTGTQGYNAIPVDFPAEPPLPRDISNSVIGGFDTHPLAIGTTPDLLTASDGTLRVRDLARFSFDMYTLHDAERAFFQDQLQSGSISFMISSLQAAGFEGMGGEEIYPRWATLETAFPVEDAELEIAFEISPPTDVNTDFEIDIEDLYSWEQGIGLRDVDGNGTVDAADRTLLIQTLRQNELNDTLP